MAGKTHEGYIKSFTKKRRFGFIELSGSDDYVYDGDIYFNAEFLCHPHPPKTILQNFHGECGCFLILRGGRNPDYLWHARIARPHLEKAL